MNRHTVPFVALLLGAALALPAVAQPEAKTENLSPQLDQSLKDLDSNGKQLVALMEKSLVGLKEFVATVEPAELGNDAARQKIEAVINPVMVGMEVTALQSFLTVLEKYVTGPGDPRLPVIMQQMGQYFLIPAEDLQKLYVDKKMPLTTVCLAASIAKAGNKPMTQVLEMYSQSKSWVEIANLSELKPQQLQKAVGGLLQFAGAQGQ